VALAVEVVAVFGPTGVGKSAVADALADRLQTEVVSADAMQAYRGLPVLTNQPERPTRLVGIWPLDHEGSVGEYEGLAHAAIDELVGASGAAVVAGGTGLYLRAALVELDLPPRPAAHARERWEERYDRDPDEAYATLARSDGAAAAVVHRNDRRRVIRALELAESGRSLVPEHARLWAGQPRRPTLVVGLDVAPDVLRERIEERTARMFERGVADEVRRALAGAISKTAEKALGLRELAELDEDQAHAAIVARTVQYAVYQRKWMRRIPDVVMIDADRPLEEMAGEIRDLARAR
jgi:tRNA dimethylallyltransferase